MHYLVDIDPIAFSIGPVAVHWYGIMYLIAFAAFWLLGERRRRAGRLPVGPTAFSDLAFYGMIGVIVGGRVGYMLFYATPELLDDPLSLFRIWEGGMSFHGGLVGVLVALGLFASRRGKHLGDVFDFAAPLPAIGFGAGRIGNFVNGELWGKPTDVPWAVVVDGVPLHASQLYEAFLEGLVLFVILWWFTARPRPRWAPSGLFLVCYGVFRFAVEFVRVPDANRGYLLFDWVTMGQILSLPMIVAGLWMIAVAYRRNQPSGNYA